MTFFSIPALRQPNRHFTKIEIDRKISDPVMLGLLHSLWKETSYWFIKFRRKKTTLLPSQAVRWNVHVVVFNGADHKHYSNYYMPVISSCSPFFPHKFGGCATFPKREDKSEKARIHRFSIIFEEASYWISHLSWVSPSGFMHTPSILHPPDKHA